MWNHWKRSDEILEGLDQSNLYMTIELGIQTINPQKIIALSRIPVESQLESLRNKVRAAGWSDPTPQGIHLVLLPDSDQFVVCSGGNHRAVISKELNLDSIQACISTYLKKELLSIDDTEFIVDRERSVNEKYMMLRRDDLSESEVNRICDEMDVLNEEIMKYKQELYFKYHNELD